MKFLFDQNISHRITKLLPPKYAESTTVKTEKLINTSDFQVWSFAKKNNFTIVTQDSDFNDFYMLYGFPPKIIWIRTGNVSTDGILNLINNHEIEILDFMQNRMTSSDVLKYLNRNSNLL